MAHNPPAARIPVAVLGATGMVGQRLVALLANHPWFELAGVVASERNVGRPYAEAVRWRIEGDAPEAARALPLVSLEDGPSLPVDVAFSGLPTAEAERIEPEFARAGVFVSSNASAYRMHPDVPLIVPEINPDHLNVLPHQRAVRDWSGALVTNPNCSAIGLTYGAGSAGTFWPTARNRHNDAGRFWRGLSRRPLARRDR